MIEQLVCALLPVFTGCDQYRERAVSVAALAAAPEAYDRERLRVRGTVVHLNQRLSKYGEPYETFSFCDGRCVRIFKNEHSPIHNGQVVTVYGDFYAIWHVGPFTYNNEVSADEILP